MRERPEQRLLHHNVVWGMKWGLYFATFFTLVAAIPALIRVFIAPTAGWQKSLSFAAIIGTYFFGGLSGGAIVGLLWNLVRWWWGRRLVGVIAAIPIMFATRIAVFGLDGWTRKDVYVWLFTAVVWGGIMSFVPEKEAKSRWPPKRGHLRRRGW